MRGRCKVIVVVALLINTTKCLNLLVDEFVRVHHVLKIRIIFTLDLKNPFNSTSIINLDSLLLLK